MNKREVIFSNDVFVAVAVVAAKTPRCSEINLLGIFIERFVQSLYFPIPWRVVRCRPCSRHNS